MEWLNYHHLLYFWTVAKEGSLRRASEQLKVSQPSISTQVHRLEHVLEEKLFQRKGRNLVLTEAGQFAFQYAEEIFSLGSEFLATIKGRDPARQRTPRFTVGIEDSFPKLLSFEILKPVLAMQPRIQLICREGKSEDLVDQLAVHRLDAVLADEPATGNTKFKVFSHLLGRSGVTICAPRQLARVLRRGFPNSLNGAPALLPTPNTTLRRSLDEWFQRARICPRVVAEFEDAALMKIAAANGEGFIAVPSVTVQECVDTFRLDKVAPVSACTDSFYLITGERRVSHSAVLLITDHARSFAFV